jgi:hypothetical protein
MCRPAVVSVLCLAMGCHGASPPAPTVSFGQRTLSRMHAAYAGSWYRDVTFRQRTTVFSQSGDPRVEQWYESLAELDGRTVLRIDVGSPREGNGVLYTADSTCVVRKGAVTARRAGGNQFLPLIEGVYVQPVSQTAAELQREGFDLAKGYERSWNGTQVSVVGAESEADSTSPQFWVDRDRHLLVRMFIALTPTQPFDVHLEHYERAGNGWLATHVALLSAGRPFQTEDYSDWHVNVGLPSALFDVNRWTSAPHWAGDTDR